MAGTAAGMVVESAAETVVELEEEKAAELEVELVVEFEAETEVVLEELEAEAESLEVVDTFEFHNRCSRSRIHNSKTQSQVLRRCRFRFLHIRHMCLGRLQLNLSNSSNSTPSGCLLFLLVQK